MMVEGTLEEDDGPQLADCFTLGISDEGDLEIRLYDGEDLFATAKIQRNDVDGVCNLLKALTYSWDTRDVPTGITELEASRGKELGGVPLSTMMAGRHIERECGEPFTKLYKVGTRVRSACDDDPRLRPLLPAGDGTVLHIQVDEAGALLTVGWDDTGATSVTRPHRLKAAPK